MDADTPLKHYAVIGSPIAHSLSPVMYNAAFDALDFPGVYTALDVPPEDLSEFIAWAKDGGLDGFNVTVPLKQRIIPFLDEADQSVDFAQSCNTVRIENGRLLGTTTDFAGLMAALKNHISREKTIAVLGCGGAVQGVVPFLAPLVSKLCILNRTLEKALPLTQKFQNVEALELNSALPPETTLVIQGTSLGLKDDDPLPYDAEKIPSEAFVFDMIYRDTPFLKACRKQHLQCRNGRDMLLYQGVSALLFYLGTQEVCEVVVEAMDNALKTAQKKNKTA